MKIHIVDKDETHIEGYEKVEITDNTFSLDKYSNNECSFVLASDCLDLIDYNNITNSLMMIRQKYHDILNQQQNFWYIELFVFEFIINKCKS